MKTLLTTAAMALALTSTLTACAQGGKAPEPAAKAAATESKETGKVTGSAQEEFGYERTTSLPTAGVIVKNIPLETSRPKFKKSWKIFRRH